MKTSNSKTKDRFRLEASTADRLGICLFRYQLSPKERFLAVNRTLAKILGYECEKEIQACTFKSLFKNPEDAKEFFRIIKKEKIVRFHEALFKRNGKEEVWVAITAHLTSSSDKKTQRIEGILEDITKHKELEERFAFEKELFQNLLDNLPDAVYFKDDKNRLFRVNRFYSDGFKMPPEEISGKTDFDFFPKQQAQKMFDDDTYVLKTGNPIIGKIERTLLPNGTRNCVTTTKIPLQNKKGLIVGTMGITRDITAYDQLEKNRLNMAVTSLKVLDRVLEIRDPYTFGHTRRVSIIAERIAQELGWDENRIFELKMSAELHDIGKILIPLEILNKPGKLSDLELKLVQEHVEKCYDMLKPHGFPFPMPEAIYQHHERLDGNGYPRGLSGEKIIPEARVLAISDVLEAMTFHRPYRAALGIKKAAKEIRDNAGSKYDKEMVNVTLKILGENNYNAFWLKQEPSI
ncbi:MAG: PAS domain-containing protein [Candidatus Omnitrophica bacterium]|nr:PAS domain-containing protein [Candidatus Omnitrophota bacterium]